MVEGDRPDWGKADWDGMRKKLGEEDWRMLLTGKTVDGAWCTLKQKIHKAVEDLVPTKRKRNCDRPVWLNQEILREIRRKKRLWTAAKTGEKVREYKEAEKKYGT